MARPPLDGSLAKDLASYLSAAAAVALSPPGLRAPLRQSSESAAALPSRASMERRGSRQSGSACGSEDLSVSAAGPASGDERMQRLAAAIASTETGRTLRE